MIKTIPEFKALIGETVFLQPTGNHGRYWEGNLEEATITKVTRVFVYAAHGPFNKEGKRLRLNEHTGELDMGYNSGWKAYHSPQEFEDRKAHIKIADKIMQYRGSSAFIDVSLEDITAAAKLLKIDIEDKES